MKELEDSSKIWIDVSVMDILKLMLVSDLTYLIIELGHRHVVNETREWRELETVIRGRQLNKIKRET